LVVEDGPDRGGEVEVGRREHDMTPGAAELVEEVVDRIEPE
jgi:hypothetical protein